VLFLADAEFYHHFGSAFLSRKSVELIKGKESRKFSFASADGAFLVSLVDSAQAVRVLKKWFLWKGLGSVATGLSFLGVQLT
jgi:hypothetical protein